MKRAGPHATSRARHGRSRSPSRSKASQKMAPASATSLPDSPIARASGASQRPAPPALAPPQVGPDGDDRREPAHEHVARREPRVRNHVRVTPREHEHRERRGRSAREDATVERAHRHDESEVPGHGVQVIEEGVRTEQRVVCGEKESGERAQEVDPQVRSGPPRQVSGADGVAVLRKVAAREAKQIVRGAPVGERGVQKRPESVVVGDESERQGRQRDEQREGNDDKTRAGMGELRRELGHDAPRGWCEMLLSSKTNLWLDETCRVST